MNSEKRADLRRRMLKIKQIEGVAWTVSAASADEVLYVLDDLDALERRTALIIEKLQDMAEYPDFERRMTCQLCYAKSEKWTDGPPPLVPHQPTCLAANLVKP